MVNRRVSDADAAEIRRLIDTGATTRSICEIVGVSTHTVWRIRHGVFHQKKSHSPPKKRGRKACPWNIPPDPPEVVIFKARAMRAETRKTDDWLLDASIAIELEGEELERFLEIRKNLSVCCLKT